MNAQMPSWSHRLDAIDDRKKDFEYAAAETERAALVEAFQLAGLETFEVRYTLQRIQEAHIRLEGELIAAGAQPCVVTLQSVPFQMRETVDVMFVPQDAYKDLSEDEEHDALSIDDVEVYSGAEVNTGRVLCEHFGAALNPYPRAPGAALPTTENDEEGGTVSPFAALKALKNRTQ